MEGVQALTGADFTREKAKEEWKRYCALIKRDPSDHVKTMKRAYHALSQGYGLIDIYEAFKLAGKHENDKPKLAISRAHLKKVTFERRRNGAGAFWSPAAARFFAPRSSWAGDGNASVALPAKTFGEWNLGNWKYGPESWRSEYTLIEALVPTVPAKFYPEGKLRNYFILWEVEPDGWEVAPVPPSDPMLLKRVSPNIFAVLAAWDLTPLEKAVIKGAALK